MAIVIPQSDLYLLKVPIEIDNKNQLTFTNATAQYNYFNSLTKHTNTEQGTFTYQRQDGTVRYPACIDDIREYNYCMYRNDGYSNKWFYAFITDMQYVSDKVTAITLKTDVWQSWMFNIEFKKSFVEREHVNSDDYFENLVEEGLETGDYVSQFSSTFSDIGESHVVMGTTVSPIDGTTDVTGGVYGGIYSGVVYYIFETNTALNNALERIAQNGKSDSIVALFYAPDWLTGYNTATFVSGIAKVPNTSISTSATGIGIPLHPTTIDGYTPRNKKLFNYPFCYSMISNNSGIEAIYKLEDFLNSDGTNIGKFNVKGVITPGCSIKCYPKDYKTTGGTFAPDEMYDEGVTLGKFPMCSWANDAYTNWLTQNGVNILGHKFNAIEAGAIGSAVNIGAGLVRTVAGDFTGGIQIGEGIGDIFSVMQSQYQHSMMSDQVEGNINCGDVTFASSNLTFTSYIFNIKKDRARLIDNFFDMFGYKVNDLKVPNITGRSNWNYVKTIGCNIDGYIPQEDMQEIKSMFNNGITLWHKTNKFLDYSESNTII